MTKAEITNHISIYLSKAPINFIDIFNKTHKTDSYEKYIHEFTLIKFVFNENIPEYTNQADIYLEKMNAFICSCEEHLDNIENYIASSFKSKICGTATSNVRLQLPFPSSLSDSPQRTDMALKVIYHELGLMALNDYIQLLKNPNQLVQYLNEPQKQLVAMHYILFATNHHSEEKLSRDLSLQKLYNLINDSINNSITQITTEKKDYINFMNKEKENYSIWFNESSERFNQLYDINKTEYEEFFKNSNSRLDALEKTYSEKLKVEEPSAFMEKKANEYKQKARGWAIATVLLSVFLIYLLSLILNPAIILTKKLITIQLFSSEMPVYSSIIILAIIALIIYVIKLFVKMTVSSTHLSEEYHQKHVLTYFYLSLIKDDKLDKEQANVILATLFSKADTGLIKNEINNEIESIYKMMLSTKS